MYIDMKADDFLEDVEALCRQYWGKKYKAKLLSGSKKPRIIVIFDFKNKKDGRNMDAD